jgi:4Fe-4S single cluster domain/Iron-sulfur cluster-binding domain
MNAGRCLTVAATNQCPLRCAHCGPASDPSQKGALESSKVAELLEQAKSFGCSIVNFSGGEPFLLGEQLVKMVASARSYGLISRVTTGAYWSSSEAAATKRLTPLVEAGLGQLFVSCSDHHAKFVPLSNVVTACRVAGSLNIQAFVAVARSKNAQLTSKVVRQAFAEANVNPPYILESPVIPFGRAQVNVPAEELMLKDTQNFAGPCPSVIEHPTVHSDGRVTGCAVVFARECEALTFGNLHESPFTEILKKMESNALANWIHRVGVVELKQVIEANSDLRFPDQHVNICHLCGDILSNEQALEVLDRLKIGPRHSVNREAGNPTQPGSVELAVKEYK